MVNTYHAAVGKWFYATQCRIQKKVVAGREKKRFEGWPGILPDLRLVKSDEEDKVVKICIFDDGTEKLLARYRDMSYLNIRKALLINTETNGSGCRSPRWLFKILSDLFLYTQYYLVNK